VDDLELNPDFQDLLIAMADAGAEFVLIGGWAVAVHGYVRGTDDLDVLVRPTPANAERVFRALASFAPGRPRHRWQRPPAGACWCDDRPGRLRSADAFRAAREARERIG